MERLLNRYFPIVDKPESMPETHIQVRITHIKACENPHENRCGFAYIAEPVVLGDDGIVSVLYDGRQKPYVRMFIPKRNTEGNRKEALSAIMLARFFIRARMNCHDFCVDFDPQNFLPCGLD